MSANQVLGFIAGGIGVQQDFQLLHLASVQFGQIGVQQVILPHRSGPTRSMGYSPPYPMKAS